MINLYSLIWPLVRCIDPELAHGLALGALKTGLVPRPRPVVDPVLRVKLWDLDFPNPIGLAAGFDKDARVHGQMLGQGFGFVEVGSITPAPQDGNPKPRLFRLVEDQAVINRMGFNSLGHDYALAQMQGRDKTSGIVAVNLGKNKLTEDAAADYELGIKAFAKLADFMVMNISSPNTKGLRALQDAAALRDLLTRTQDTLKTVCKGSRTPPLVLKIAPDLTDEDKADIAHVALDTGLDGLIVSNTTIDRPVTLKSNHRAQGGGLSGRPLFEPSTRVLGEMYTATQGKIPLIGVGGIENAQGAYEKILAGASLVELYSAMIFQGPAIAATINRDLAKILKSNGFTSVMDAVGKAN